MDSMECGGRRALVVAQQVLTGPTGPTGPAGYSGIPYTFSTTTTDSDPGAGILRLSNATQNAATVVRADLLDNLGNDWTVALNSLDDSTSAIKGYLRLVSELTPTDWLVFTVTSVASPAGYRNITVVNIDSSSASPFTDGEAIRLQFDRTGDAGTDGVDGTPGLDGAPGLKPAGQLFLSAAGMWPTTDAASSIPTKVEYDTNDINMYHVDFADGASKLFAEASVVMPSDWNGGTVTATFYWTANSTSTNNVLWGCAGRSYGNFETIDQAVGTEVTVQDALNGTANQVAISPATAAITITGGAAGELVHFKVSRDPTSGSDTLAATARLIGVMISYTRTA